MAGQVIPRITMHCSTCGGEDIVRDAWAEWNPSINDWELRSIFDQFYCEDCESNCDCIEKEETT